VFDKEFREVRIQIAFRPKDQYFAVADATTQRDPEFIDDITELWAGRRGRNRFVKDFLRQLRESREVSEDEEDDLSESIDRLYDVQSYPFTALELASEVDEERVAEVFVRINSKGVTLNQADFILTLLSVFWEDGRKELEAFARAARVPSTSGPSPFNHFIEPGARSDAARLGGPRIPARSTEVGLLDPSRSRRRHGRVSPRASGRAVRAAAGGRRPTPST
jgi:hypothetical protein